MYKISTQLAKAVFNIGEFFYKDNPTESVQIENGVITYAVGKSNFTKQVDSFFFDCKQWAINLDYELVSFIMKDNYMSNCEVWYEYHQLHKIVANTEQQAVFNACEYILKELKC